MAKMFNFLGGMALGAACGAALSLLLTPQSGKELKHAAHERVNLVLTEGRRAAAERRAELEAQFAQAKQVTRA